MENDSSRRSAKTVRIITDFPVLIQSESSVTRQGRNKPTTVLHGGYLFSFSLTDSGDPVLRIAEPVYAFLYQPECARKSGVEVCAASYKTAEIHVPVGA